MGYSRRVDIELTGSIYSGSNSSFTLSARHKEYLPKLHLHEGTHPLWPYGKAYYIIYDHTLTYQQRLERKVWEGELQVPACIDDQILQAETLTKLEWGDAIFFRFDINKPRRDLLAACVAPESLVKNMKPFIDAALEQIIGDREACKVGKPTKEGGVLSGGTAFERALGRNQNNTQGARCYANGITVETGTGVIGPASNLSGRTDPALEMRQKLNYVRRRLC